MMALPEEFVFQSHVFKKIASKSDGMSEGAIYYRDENPAIRYFLKIPKKRSLESIFYNVSHTETTATEAKEIKTSIAPQLTALLTDLKIAKESKDSEKISKLKSEMAKYKQHKQDLILTHSFEAVFATKFLPKIIPKIVVPDTFLLIDKKDRPILKENTPILISAEIEGFTETLSQLNLFRGITKPDDYKAKNAQRPTPELLISELKLTSLHLQAIGRLYFIALLTGHWDIFNNVNLTNSGFVKDHDNTLLPAIVDLEPILGAGFGSMSDVDSAFKNPQFVSENFLRSSKISPTDFDDFTGFSFCVPWDEKVLPILPRQLATGLLEFDGNEKSDFLKGFEAAVNESKVIIEKDLAKIISTTLVEVKETCMTAVDAKKIDSVINATFYSTDSSVQPVRDTYKKYASETVCIGQTTASCYTLNNILMGRMKSIEKILIDFKRGFSSRMLADSIFKDIVKDQIGAMPPTLISMASRTHSCENDDMHYCSTAPLSPMESPLIDSAAPLSPCFQSVSRHHATQFGKTPSCPSLSSMASEKKTEKVSRKISGN